MFSAYTLAQWFVIFFIYCVIGWIWECSYVFVSRGIRSGKFVMKNRGFLNGPYIPIYGFSAVVILVATYSFRDNIILIFIVGAAAASLFELVAGTALEAVFGVKYWDYSHLWLNYKGRVCLFISLFWGALSVFLIRFVHQYIETFVLGLSNMTINISAVILFVIVIADTVESAREAYDVKDLFDKLSEYREVLDKLSEYKDTLEKRANAVVAFGPVAKLEKTKQRLKGYLDPVIISKNRKYIRVYRHMKRTSHAMAEKYKKILKEYL